MRQKPFRPNAVCCNNEVTWKAVRGVIGKAKRHIKTSERAMFTLPTKIHILKKSNPVLPVCPVLPLLPVRPIRNTN